MLSFGFASGQNKKMFIKSILVDTLVLPNELNKIDFQLMIRHVAAVNKRFDRSTVKYPNVSEFPVLIEFDKPVMIKDFDETEYLEVVNSLPFNKKQTITNFAPFAYSQIVGYPIQIPLKSGLNSMVLNVYWE